MDVTEEFVRAIFARAIEPTALLVTIRAEGLEEPIRATSHPDGLTSGGIEYPFFPFGFAWGGAAADEPSKEAKLEIGNTDGRISTAVRQATGDPRIDVELVRVSAPDVVELAMIDAKIENIEVDDPTVTATIKPRAFEDEPANKARYIAARTPGLFA